MNFQEAEFNNFKGRFYDCYVSIYDFKYEMEMWKLATEENIK